MAVELRFEQGMFRLLSGDGVEERIAVERADIEAFLDWAQRYEQATSRKDNQALLAIGREINTWLDKRALEKLHAGERDIHFATVARPDADQLAFWTCLGSSSPIATATGRKMPSCPTSRPGYWAH
jgi:hypothetical protein